MNRINYFHSLIFFNICILLSAFDFLHNNDFLIISLFLILSLGISHGALDHLKGMRLLKILKYETIYIFYFFYILLALIVIFAWMILPKFLLLLFLIVASYHFGKEDSEFIKLNSKNDIIYFFKGSLVIAAPLLFHKSETLKIFMDLNFNVSQSFFVSNEFIYFLIGLSFISNIIISLNKDINIKALLLMDFISVLLINFFLQPILAFTIYFCFLHSIRHSFKLSNELNTNNFVKGVKKFIIKAVPLTILTAILFLVSLFLLNNYYILDAAVSKVIFIGLASLTFPHILLEYLVEKNEK